MEHGMSSITDITASYHR